MSGRSKKKDKLRVRTGPEHAPNTELAKLLGNRTRALLTFEDPSFTVEGFLATYLGQLSEKAIDNARQDLGALLATCTEEVESVVQQHHQRFLQACAGVEALEDQVALLRNYINGLSALVASLKSALKSGSNSSSSRAQPGGAQAGGGGRRSHAGVPPDSTASPVMQQIEADLELLLQELDLAAAGRDLPSAVSWLKVADDVGTLLDRDASLLVMEVDDFPGWRHSYDAAVGLRKQRLVFLLQRQLSDANASSAEIGSSAAALMDLVGEGPALQAMLNCYSHKIRLDQSLLLKQHTAGSDPNSLEFAGRLVQRTLLTIAAAGDALVATFGVEQRALGSMFAVWASREARGCAGMLRQHVLSAATAASTGLHTTIHVVAMSLVLCAMLEDSHSISLSSVFSTELWPSIDTALRRHLKRFTEEMRMSAAEEVNSLVVSSLTAAEGRGTSGSMPVQVPSLVTCVTLRAEVTMLAELLAPIANPQLAATFRRALLDIFLAATQTISFTLKSHLEDPSAGATLSSLLPGIMEVLAGLIENDLPEAVLPFTLQAGPVIDGRAMDRALNNLYRECTTSARAAKAAGRAASRTPPAAAGVKVVGVSP